MNRASSLPNASLISRHNTQPLNRVTFDECLAKFFELEMLPTTELLTCDYCRRKSNVSKQTAIYQLPKVLVIHLKRFVFSEKYMDFEKINDIVEIK